jgi:hypothetical protein
LRAIFGLLFRKAEGVKGEFFGQGASPKDNGKGQKKSLREPSKIMTNWLFGYLG